MAQPEARVSRKCITDLRLMGCFCFKVWGSEHMMAGLPDIIGVYRGMFFGLEVKMPEKRGNTSARQDYVHEQIRKAGGLAEVVCSSSEATKAVRDGFVIHRRGLRQNAE